MAFRGLFIGIDRYASPSVNWLSCARRDATALHALFSDTFGEEATLLTDAAATRSAIEAQFVDLATCSPDDVVVIGFSGHGSPTHELITYDADVTNLAGTCISLDVLTAWFSRIPARRLICILDCCFSGGFGAKVLTLDAAPRNLVSTAYLLDQMAGDGRLIFTASSATEPAWENARFGHGYLTQYLLEALLGAEEVRQGGKISVYRLLEYVTQRVIAAAAQHGQPQHPALRGQLDGELTWPIFTPGEHYKKAFPDRMTAPVTEDIASLASYGFPPALLAAWGAAIPSLNQLQRDAINDFGLLNGEHLVVSAPTSSGKTMIGELAALKGCLERKRALFLLPLKALVNDKYGQFTETYGAFGLRTIRATGEITDDVPQLMRGQYDICLMTYEKFSALVLANPFILEQVGTIVIDEMQMIADKNRGVNLEFIMTLLRMRRREEIEPQLIALSAVIGDTNGFERWLGARLLRRDERPVPLDEGILLADGTFRFVDPQGNEQVHPAFIQRVWRKGSSQDWIIPLVHKLVSDGQQVIVFRETRGDARGCARYLAESLGLPPAQDALDALPDGDPSTASTNLREALMGGIAFHISDLDRDERRVVEEQFRTPGTTLRVIAATTTLAMGVNTPASSVVIAGLEHPDGSYAVAEYKNMVGRAGRLGYAERGTSYLLAVTPKEEFDFWSHYVRGVPEDIVSRFFADNTDPRSLIASVLAATPGETGLSAEDIVDFLHSSFGAFQQMQAAPSWHLDEDTILASLNDLEQHQLVLRTASGGYRLTDLGKLAGENRVEVTSITRLVDAFKLLGPESITEHVLVAAAQLTMELDQVNFPINKRGGAKERQTWMGELQRHGVPYPLLGMLDNVGSEQHQGALRAKKTVGCFLWMTEASLADIEAILTRHGGAFNGASGPLRNVSARTCDLLPTVVRVAEIVHPGLTLADRQQRLITRLEVGVPAEVVELAQYAGLRLSRGDYRRLLAAGLISIDQIEASGDEPLLACIDNNKTKLTLVRAAVTQHRERLKKDDFPDPILPPYEANA